VVQGSLTRTARWRAPSGEGEGTLQYPGPTGEKSETLSLDCTTVEDFGGCDPPGSPPRLAPS
jgi:hypothetical protein